MVASGNKRYLRIRIKALQLKLHETDRAVQSKGVSISDYDMDFPAQLGSRRRPAIA